MLNKYGFTALPYINKVTSPFSLYILIPLKYLGAEWDGSLSTFISKPETSKCYAG